MYMMLKVILIKTAKIKILCFLLHLFTFFYFLLGICV